MTDLAGGESALSEKPRKKYYKKDFWREENLKFSQPWYRLDKVSRLIAAIADGQECDLLDVGCGPATLMGLLPTNIHYHGIDIAIQKPAPNLIEADLVESPIRFGDKRFDIVVAQGVFEYLGDFQSQKLAEISEILKPSGTFVVSYTNFDHRKTQLYWPFSNIQSIEEFRQDLRRHFTVDRAFPTSHNWKHAHPNRPSLKRINMHVNANIPLLSPRLAVEYLFFCSSLDSTVP